MESNGVDEVITNIDDLRNDFKNITFSKFQKSKAKQELIKCIYNNKIENANYWSAEFICAGHYLDLWEIIILYATRYIHSGNPKLPIYLNMRFDNFSSIINVGYTNDMLILRNNNKIRKLFSEIICVLCYSNKKQIYQQIKLNKSEEFDLINLSTKFKAPNVSFVETVFKDDDPTELLIPINELIYNITTGNMIEVCYWYEWIIEYENISNKKKKICNCQARSYAPVGSQNHIIWIIWDILFYYTNPENSIYKNTSSLPIVNKIIKSLYSLFIIKYKSTSKTKRKYIIYYAFSILTDNIDFDTALINDTNKDKIKVIVEKIDNVYRDIKKNEETPANDTDNPLKNHKKSNMEKTIERLEIMNNF
tara:strand:- start:332 stop:1423 length:1092 start_codon:yes stop_codon:yes gene_type:complete